MEMEIKVAKRELIKTKDFSTVKANVPQEAKYYRKVDDGNFFPEGEILFAIIPWYTPKEGKPVTYFRLVRVTQNCQQSTDFSLTKDCKDSYFTRQYTPLKKAILDWISGNKRIYEYTWLRPEAFSIMSDYNYVHKFFEITEEDFNTSRQKLLDNYLKRH